MSNCDDFNCKEFLPQYGIAPHSHDIAGAGGIIGSTRVFPKKDWPWNFVEDPECPGLGTWYCDKCGNGILEVPKEKEGRGDE